MTTATLERSADKKRFRVTHKTGKEFEAKIPPEMTVAEAISPVAARAGYPPEPSISVRYALWARGPHAGERPDEFTVLTDDTRFGDLPDDTVLRVATQPRPATAERIRG